MNIFHVHNVWKHDNEQDKGHPPITDDHVKDIVTQPPIPHDTQMLSQIWGGIPDLHQGLNNLMINVNRGFDRVHQRIDRLEKRFDNFQDSFQ